MKNILITLTAIVCFSSCSIMKKHKDVSRRHIDSSAVTHVDSSAKITTTTEAADTSTVMASKTVTQDVDTAIHLPATKITATLVAGKQDSAIDEDGNKIAFALLPGGHITITVSTPPKTMPIKIHSTMREVDTTTAITHANSTQSVNAAVQATVATTVKADNKSFIKTKAKSVFSFPWYVWLLASLAGIIYLAWRNRATIAKWFV